MPAEPNPLDQLVPRKTVALLDHCIRTYAEMKQQGKFDPTQNVTIYDGHLTKLIARLNYSTPYYSKITQALIKMGCIHQLRRGGGGSSSEWLLKQAPDAALFETFVAIKTLGSKNSPGGRTAMLEQQIRGLSDRVTRLEDVVFNVTGVPSYPVIAVPPKDNAPQVGGAAEMPVNIQWPKPTVPDEPWVDYEPVEGEESSGTGD